MKEESQELYRAAVAEMDTKTLLEEFEARAAVMTTGTRDPVTATMLKIVKAELTKRLKSYQPSEKTPAKSKVEEPKEEAKPNLFS